MQKQNQIFTLSQLAETYPIESGSVEVLGYVQLAHDAGYEVDDSKTELIPVASHDSDQTAGFIEVPVVRFGEEPARENLNEVAQSE